MIPGPQSHAAKIAFEKYFLWKMRHGYVGLPSDFWTRRRTDPACRPRAGGLMPVR